MEYTRLGTSGLKVSRIALGCMSFGDPAKRMPWVLDDHAAEPIFQQAVDLGVYIIVDFHRVQNFGATDGGVPREIVQEYWDYVAPRYADIPNVIYEVYNEPINPASWPQ